ncbi:hypothetical protein CMI37_16625 [Candidatus Pacearchaeota archaeon]|nr:hypothetical protein [Candidatus Pacearchaeota archaeon]
MSNAKRNRGRLTPSQIRKAKRAAADWKWFTPREFEQQLKMIEWDDPDYPDGVLIECGNLARIHFRAPAGESSRHPRRRRDTTITFSKPVARQSYLAFDPEHPDDRLYMLVKPSASAFLAERFWQDNPVEAKALSEWAMLAGGRHSRGGYPNVMAKPVGVMTAVVYFCHKKDDGPSFYVHKMGEMSCYYPILCCDSRGRLWVCGGNYRNPTPGITD